MLICCFAQQGFPSLQSSPSDARRRTVFGLRRLEGWNGLLAERQLDPLGDVQHRQIRLPHVALRTRLDPLVDAFEKALAGLVVECPMV